MQALFQAGLFAMTTPPGTIGEFLAGRARFGWWGRGRTLRCNKRRKMDAGIVGRSNRALIKRVPRRSTTGRVEA